MLIGIILGYRICEQQDEEKAEGKGLYRRQIIVSVTSSI
jgi:hypothetical protein